MCYFSYETSMVQEQESLWTVDVLVSAQKCRSLDHSHLVYDTGSFSKHDRMGRTTSQSNNLIGRMAKYKRTARAPRT